MIRIKFLEPTNSDWVDWRNKCKTETTKLVAAVKNNKEKQIKDVLYKKQKAVYFNENGPFRGKCAYCEQKIVGDQHGDIEHYRPKGKVTDEDDKEIIISEKGKKKPHPGYYWLAYDWRNLLPSCGLCNKPATEQKTGEAIGKRNRFPINGSRAVKPGKESLEKPLLLHPCSDYPSKHLKIDETGIFSALSKRGEMCIKVLGLNLRGLPGDRKKVYDDVKNRIGILVQGLVTDPNGDKTKERVATLNEIKDGYGAFTAVALKAIDDSKENLRELVSFD